MFFLLGEYGQNALLTLCNYTVNKTGHYEVYYKRSTDGGGHWDWMKRLSWTSGGDAVNPDIAVHNNEVHVVWSGFRGYTGSYTDSEIYYRRSLDGGTVWKGKKRLSWTSYASENPSIDAWSSLVDVAWSDLGPNPYRKLQNIQQNQLNQWSLLGKEEEG